MVNNIDIIRVVIKNNTLYIFSNQSVIFLATGTVKTSRIQNHGSVVVCPILRSVSSTWERREPQWTISRYVYTWSQMNTNSWALKPWKRVVFAVTSILLRTAAKISSISAWGCIHSMSSASTKCYRVLELIGMWIQNNFINCNSKSWKMWLIVKTKLTLNIYIVIFRFD